MHVRNDLLCMHDIQICWRILTKKRSTAIVAFSRKNCDKLSGSSIASAASFKNSLMSTSSISLRISSSMLSTEENDSCETGQTV